jgi:hypothetical protein
MVKRKKVCQRKGERRLEVSSDQVSVADDDR